MNFDEAYMSRIARMQYPGDTEAMDQGQAMGLEQAAMQATVGTLPQDTKDITAAQFGKMAMDVPAGLLKGGVQATIGLPGDLISLGRGIAAAINPQPGEGRLDAFLRGTDGRTILPTTEDVKKFIDETLGMPLVPASETDQMRREAGDVSQFVGELGGAGKTMAAGARGAAGGAAKTKTTGTRSKTGQTGQVTGGQAPMPGAQ